MDSVFGPGFDSLLLHPSLMKDNEVSLVVAMVTGPITWNIRMQSTKLILLP